MFRRKKIQKEPMYFGKYVFDRLKKICEDPKTPAYTLVRSDFPHLITIKAERRRKQSDFEMILKSIYTEHGVESSATCAVEYKARYGDDEFVVATVHELTKPNCSFAVYKADGLFVVDFLHSEDITVKAMPEYI